MTIPQPPKRTAPQDVSSKKTRKTYSLAFKAQVVTFMQAQVEKDNKAYVAAALERFKSATEGIGLSKQTVSQWYGQRESILKGAATITAASASGRMRARKVGNEEVEEATRRFCVEMSAKGLLLPGHMIREKAALFQEKMGGGDGKFSKGWLYSFLKHYGIKATVAHGEAGSVSEVTANEERVRVQQILKEYDRRDVYNFDETSLFWRAVPTRGYAVGMFSGVKQGKERISLGFCCNADGTDKRPIAYVGQSAKPRAFAGKTPNNYGYRYWNNKKAWFNSIIFGEWLSELDQEMRKQDRQIILLVDNFSAHQKALQTFTPTNVKMEFFSANLTSHCQPLDQGIIRAFKAHFQLRKTRYTLGRLELGDDDPWKVTIRQAMTFADEAWKNVTAETCFNCWKHSGVLPGTGPSAPAAKTQDEAAPEVDQSNDRNRAWDIVMHALDHEQSIPELVSALTTSLGEGFDLSEWQAAINLTCYEDDEAREENRTTLQGLRSKDPLSQTDDGAGKVLGKAGEVKTTTSEKMPELVELEAALGLALLQTGCIEGKQSLAVAELLGDDIQVQAQDDVEMTKLDEEELVTEIVNRMKQEKADVVELSDEEEEEGETMPPSVSKYAGDMSEELLAEINEAVKTLSNLTIARPEEHFVDKLGRDLQQLKKWSDKAHFHLPRKQPTIKSFFSKSATNADTVSTLTTDMEE